MTVIQSLAAFVLAAGLLTVTPGLDTALVLRTAAVGRPRRAWGAAVGIGLGCLVWGAAAGVGLGALLAASRLAFDIVRGVGTAYLLWLGVKLLAKPRRSLEIDTGAPSATGAAHALRTGLMTNLLNPKVGVFYVTFLPQFVPAGVNATGFIILLAALHVAMGLAWCAVLIGAMGRLAPALRAPKLVTALDRATGGVFVLFGIKLALSRA